LLVWLILRSKVTSATAGLPGVLPTWCTAQNDNKMDRHTYLKSTKLKDVLSISCSRY